MPAVAAAVTAATAVEEPATVEAAVVTPVVVTGRDVAERGRGAIEAAPVRLRRLTSLKTATTQCPQTASEQQHHPAHPEPRRDLSVDTGEQDASAYENYERREEPIEASHNTVIRYERAISEAVPRTLRGPHRANAV